MRFGCAPALAGLLVAASMARAGGVNASEARAWAVDDGARIRRGDIDSPLARGDDNPLWRPGEPIRLAAFRDEVVAFQIVIEAGDAELSGVAVDLPKLVGPKGAAALAIDRFVEHYIEVHARSRNEERPLEALGWSPAARPPDDRVLGLVPDALVPIELAARSTWLPYPMRIAPHTNGAIWLDVYVPPDAAPGAYRGAALVTSSGGAPLAHIPVELSVRAPHLPYRAVRFFAYYDVATLRGRLGDAAVAEPQLWQLLHAHHVDALATLDSPDDARRLASALDGTLFTPQRGYLGPGHGAAPGVASIGTYGALGDPGDEALQRVRAIAPLIPPAVEDVILYAVDEQCKSPRGPTWRRLLRGVRELERVRVAHTCSEDPAKQDVDVVLMTADEFDPRAANRARTKGKLVWVYNGALPRTGTLLLDADATSLRASAWIAARHAVDRWFFWETTFWDDGNRGGHGPVDPFVTAESFHNQHGDASLGDGLLLYPGAQTGAFAAHSFGFAGVLPSIRLKNLRRGIQDAGIYALARAAHAEQADAIVDRLVPKALSDVPLASPPPWPWQGAPFARATEELRALVPDGAAMTPTEVAKALPRTTTRSLSGWRLGRAAMIVVVLVSALAVGIIALRRRKRR